MTREERDKAIRILQWLHNNNFLFRSTEEDVKFATEYAIEALEQEPKEGHWKVVSDGYGDIAYICECSECKDTVWVYKDADRKWNFCPNCGAKMV